MPRTWKSLALTCGLALAGVMTVGCGEDKAPLPVKHTTSDGGASRPRPGDDISKTKKSLPRLDD